MCSASAVVFIYPRVREASAAGVDRRCRRRARPADQGSGGAVAHLPRLCVVAVVPAEPDADLLTLFAVLLGTGGLLSQASGGGALFTLSLPVSRNRLLGVRAATGLAELLVLAFVPSLLLPLLSPAHRSELRRSATRSFTAPACSSPGARALQPDVSAVHGVQRRVASAADRPLRCGGARVLRPGLSRQLSRYSLFRIMSAESYFRGGGLPWLGLLASAARVGGDAVRRRREHRAPGFLTSEFLKGEWPCTLPCRTSLVAALLLVAAPFARAQAPADPSGHWEGSVQIPGTELNIEVDLAKNSQGGITGTLGSSDQKGFPLATAAIEGQSISFHARLDQPFEGILSADGQSISGTATLEGFSLPFRLTRTGDRQD